jgi:hypothetical protein
LLQGSSSHAACHLDYPFFLRAFDNCGNTEIRPDPQTGPPTSRRLFDLLSEGSHDATRIRVPPIGTNQQRAHRLTTSANIVPCLALKVCLQILHR